MRSTIIGVFLLTSLVFASPSAHALSLSVSQADLDWSGLTYTISGGLTVTKIVPGHSNAYSFASTALGGSSYQNDNASPNFTSAASSYSNALGFASSNASSSDGLLQSTSVAGTSLMSWNTNSAQASTGTSSGFWLYGSGNGSLTVSVPYSLTINIFETVPGPIPGVYDVASATASAYLLMGPGAGWYTSDVLSWPESNSPLNGMLTKTGTFTLSRNFINPYWGPLVGIWANTNTSVTASVLPEPSTLWLLGTSLVVILGLGFLRNRLIDM